LAPVWLALSAAAAHADTRDITIGYVTVMRERLDPVSPLDVRASDEGLQGARLGTADNATTGRFTGQAFRLEERILEKDGDAVATLERLAAAGIRFVVVDLDARRTTRIEGYVGSAVFTSDSRWIITNDGAHLGATSIDGSGVAVVFADDLTDVQTVAVVR